MPKFYKRGALGRMIEAEGGSSDPDLAEVRMSVEEYRGLWERIRKAERATEVAKADAKKREDEAYRSANRQLTEYKQKADVEAERKVSAAQANARRSEEEASSLRAELSTAREALQEEKYLHGNMIRIMKERANQARGIKPKKDHDGYVVLESRQWTERYTEDVWDTDEHREYYDSDKDRQTAIKNGYLRIAHKTAEVWKSTIQTPYNASLPIKQVRERIEEEIGRVLDDVNVVARLRSEYNGIYHNFGTDGEGREKNGMYRWKYRANYRSGLWELEIFTTKDLQVPEQRRPRQRIKGRGRNSEQEIGTKNMYADDTGLEHT